MRWRGSLPRNKRQCRNRRQCLRVAAEKLKDAGEFQYSERHRRRVHDLEVDVLVTVQRPGLIRELDRE
jgi:hypothetical protein